MRILFRLLLLGLGVLAAISLVEADTHIAELQKEMRRLRS
jgi:hypothetical protein